MIGIPALRLGDVMAALIESSIQVAMISALPKNITVHIGDEARGPVAHKTVRPQDFGDLAQWFVDAGRKHYPKSAFATIQWVPE